MGGALLLALALAITGLLALGSAGAGAVKQPKIKQPTCGKAKSKQCKTNARVRELVGQFHYFGTFKNGEPIDVTYCLNGAVADDVRLSTSPFGTGWKVTAAKLKDNKNFTAILKSRKGRARFDRSISRHGKKWKLGRVSKQGKPKGLVPVERETTFNAETDQDRCDVYGVELDLPPLEAEEEN